MACVRILLLLLALLPGPLPARDDGSASLTVYLKWVGASGRESDVRISLDCEDGRDYGYRYINEDAAGGWDISGLGAAGMLCNVTEEERDSYRRDIIDCQGLYIVPGAREECTLVNTKIVKRIEMFNRYGVFVLILLVLGVGLIAIRRAS